MIVRELAENYKLKVAAGAEGLDREVRRGYCGDSLSDVMANAPIGCVWLTVQGTRTSSPWRCRGRWPPWS